MLGVVFCGLCACLCVLVGSGSILIFVLFAGHDVTHDGGRDDKSVAAAIARALPRHVNSL